MTDKDKGKLLLAFKEKESETMTAIGATEKKRKSKENETWYEGYEAGMSDAKEVVEEFGRPTEDVLG